MTVLTQITKSDLNKIKQKVATLEQRAESFNIEDYRTTVTDTVFFVFKSKRVKTDYKGIHEFLESNCGPFYQFYTNSTLDGPYYWDVIETKIKKDLDEVIYILDRAVEYDDVEAPKFWTDWGIALHHLHRTVTD